MSSSNSSKKPKPIQYKIEINEYNLSQNGEENPNVEQENSQSFYYGEGGYNPNPIADSRLFSANNISYHNSEFSIQSLQAIDKRPNQN